MLILTFGEFNNKFNIDNNAKSDIRIKDIGKDISLKPIEIAMRDETPDSIHETTSPICEAGSLTSGNLTSTLLSIYIQLMVHIGF